MDWLTSIDSRVWYTLLVLIGLALLAALLLTAG